MISLGEEYPCRSYGPSWKLFADPTVDKKGNVHSEQNVHLALYQRSVERQQCRPQQQRRYDCTQRELMRSLCRCCLHAQI